MAAVSPSRQSPAAPAKPREPQQDKEKSAKEKSDEVARNAAIAGAIGAALGAKAAWQEGKSSAKIAARALNTGALFAAGAGAFTASEGNVWNRALAGLGASFVAGAASSLATKAAKQSAGEVNRPYV